MRRVLLGVCLGLNVAAGLAATERPLQSKATTSAKAIPDSRQLEKGLQSLSWKQFKSVVEAIPPIKAEVDKYGALGWQFVQQSYRTYSWKGIIDRLEVSQKHELARLIERAKNAG